MRQRAGVPETIQTMLPALSMLVPPAASSGLQLQVVDGQLPTGARQTAVPSENRLAVGSHPEALAIVAGAFKRTSEVTETGLDPRSVNWVQFGYEPSNRLKEGVASHVPAFRQRQVE